MTKLSDLIKTKPFTGMAVVMGILGAIAILGTIGFMMLGG